MSLGYNVFTYSDLQTEGVPELQDQGDLLILVTKLRLTPTGRPRVFISEVLRSGLLSDWH